MFFMNINKDVVRIIEILEKSGFEAYVVGGSVRDLLMGKIPKDWDLTTNALPEKMIEILPDARYENIFGTVIVPVRNNDDKVEHVVEITTYRSEVGYTDRRRPDNIVFEKELEKDLERRDFTINAMAMDKKMQLIDLFGGQKDLKKRIIRAVGEPFDRFKEDSLRMMRAIRFSAQLDFEIEPKTERAMVKLAGSIKFVANERIKDELTKILSSKQAYDGIMKLYQTKLLQYIIPELLLGVGMNQAHHHINTVFEHNMLSLKHCPSEEWQVCLAALLHDVGKPGSMKMINGEPTFYNHEYIGAKLVNKIMQRLKFGVNDTKRVVNLVRNHMFYYNVGEVTEHSVRRLIAKVGKENLHDLMNIRMADRLSSGVKKAKPYKLRHLEYMLEKVQHDPVSVKELKINGHDIMDYLKIAPGPKIGQIMDVLLSEVIEDPKNNEQNYLLKRSFELNKMNLEDFRAHAKKVIMDKRVEDDMVLRKDFKI